MDRVFIFDCTGEIVGNPNGYRTMKGAIRQAHIKGSKAYRAIWRAYNEAKRLDPDLTLINRIGHKMDF